MQATPLLALLAAATHAALASGATHETVWFDSAVDHFNMSSVATFRQRCLVDATHLRSAGRPEPAVYFYTGNEGPIEEFANNALFVNALAERHGALAAFCEHRYYGQSLPFGPRASFTRQGMGLLSVEQALADYAAILPRLKARYGLPDSSPTVAFGGSYGGMLAAWWRYKYPALVDAAVAASAPIPLPLGAAAKPGFYEAVGDDLRSADPSCPHRVRAAMGEIVSLLRSGDEGGSGHSRLETVLHLCPGQLARRGAGAHLLAWARNAFVVLAMCDYPAAASFLAPLPAWPINAACRLLAAGGAVGERSLLAAGEGPATPEGVATSALYGLASVLDLVYNESAAQVGSAAAGQGRGGKEHLAAHVQATSQARSARARRTSREKRMSHISMSQGEGGGGGGDGAHSPEGGACHDLATEYVMCADQTGCGLGTDSQAWDYQVCTELPLLVSTTNVTDPFPPQRWGLEELTAYCQATWGVRPRQAWAQLSFGGTPEDPARGLRRASSRIAFSNGLLDPWHGGGFLQDITPDLPAIILPKGAHHLDLRAEDDRDPPGARTARAREAALVEKWVAAARAERGGAAALHSTRRN